MSNKPTESTVTPDVPANFIVEVPGKNGPPTFFVCQTTQIISPGKTWGDLSHQAISEYIAGHGLKAAPLPGRPLERKEFTSGPSR